MPDAKILYDESRIVDIIRDRQAAMRREMDRRGILMKVVAADSGLSYATLLTYFPADAGKVPTQIPGSAIFALTGHLPADILSTLLPAGHVIVKAPEALDHDEVAQVMLGYLSAKAAAHRPESPGGREIVDCEDRGLREQFATLRAVG